MRYTYKIIWDTDNHTEQEIIEAMSFKKMLIKLKSKFSNQIVTVFYKNKKNNNIEKIIDTGKIKQKD
jgi:hypothetical protein|tara:strand:- start:23 stop:223 length:201 start_codon:yes stop_codon:yes gene_type:complete